MSKPNCLICKGFPEFDNEEILTMHIGTEHPTAARVIIMALGLMDLSRPRLEECVGNLATGVAMNASMNPDA